MPEELAVFVTICQKRGIQTPQHWVEKAGQNQSSGTGFASPRPPAAPKAPKMGPANSVAGYTNPVPMHLSSGKRRMSAVERAKRFADGRCGYCGGLNHSVADCAVRKTAQTINDAGAEIMDASTGCGSKQSRKAEVSQ
jgi:hypothetical protein